MASKPWPKLWASTPELLRLARQQSYLIAITATGTISCKACGREVPWEPLDLHFARHMRELDAYLAKQREETREESAEGFYPKPCVDCDKPIPRTGKPGRPPIKCDLCAFPNAKAVLEELGL